MFRTIVVGTDWSDTAEVAFAKALELARADEGAAARGHCARSSAPPVIGGAARPSAGPDFQADVVLDRLLEQHGATDLDVKQHMASEEPADAILAVADQVGADLIVVGNQGMRRRVLGSIPNTVSHRAPCDVLIVQNRLRRCSMFKSIVVGTDGSETADSRVRARPAARRPDRRAAACGQRLRARRRRG